MKIIENNFIPIFGAYAMAVYPKIYVRKYWIRRMDEFRVMYNKDPGGGEGDRYAKRWYDRVISHEKIHFEQQKELGKFKFFLKYIWYFLRYGDLKNPFEKEAYENQEVEGYLETRQPHAYKNYIK